MCIACSVFFTNSLEIKTAPSARPAHPFPRGVSRRTDRVASPMIGTPLTWGRKTLRVGAELHVGERSSSFDTRSPKAMPLDQVHGLTTAGPSTGSSAAVGTHSGGRTIGRGVGAANSASGAGHPSRASQHGKCTGPGVGRPPTRIPRLTQSQTDTENQSRPPVFIPRPSKT
jgi:hypothetical protein